MAHCITFVDDDALPEGHDFVFVGLPAGAHIFYRRSAVTEDVLEDSWAAYRALQQRRSPGSPARMVAASSKVAEFLSRAS